MSQVSAGEKNVYHAVAKVRPFVIYLTCTSTASGSAWTELEFDDSTWPLQESVSISDSVKDVHALRFLLDNQWLVENADKRSYCRLYRKSYRVRSAVTELTKHCRFPGLKFLGKTLYRLSVHRILTPHIYVINMVLPCISREFSTRFVLWTVLV